MKSANNKPWAPPPILSTLTVSHLPITNPTLPLKKKTKKKPLQNISIPNITSPPVLTLAPLSTLSLFRLLMRPALSDSITSNPYHSCEHYIQRVMVSLPNSCFIFHKGIRPSGKVLLFYFIFGHILYFWYFYKIMSYLLISYTFHFSLVSLGYQGHASIDNSM